MMARFCCFVTGLLICADHPLLAIFLILVAILDD